ncbi:hypothetical protein BC629DRAFT_1540798 [Irpex lacteus]|nr:hypothetical protein BC629DRAFT_1540798 [Irpex lacteus]
MPVVRHLRRHNLSNAFLISRCILYNGTIQFTVVSITTVLNLLGSLSPTAGDTEVFVIILASVLLSRFILDLRREDSDVAEKGDSDSLLRRVFEVSNIHFAGHHSSQAEDAAGGSVVINA